MKQNREMLSGIVGNITLRQRLGQDIADGALPHALILEGPSGTGKHTIATQCAAALSCLNQATPEYSLPCMECVACRKILEGKAADLIVLGCDGKASIGVDTIRFLREDVRIVPNDFAYKVYVIEDADKMTEQAQNALLLTLEEPPTYARFFLLCENAELLLETIRSRAPILRTQPIDTEQMDRYLCQIDRRAAQMKMADSKTFAQLLLCSKNGIGQALRYLDPKVFEPVLRLRSLASDFVCAAICDRSARKILSLLSRFSPKRDALREQLFATAEAINDLILLKKSEEATLSFYADREQAIELCDKASLSFLYSFQAAIHQAMDENAQNANVRLCLIKLAVTSGLL